MSGTNVIDIYSKGEYPADVLSNFYPNSFVFDGVECASMEGLLQSLKTRNIKKQISVCAMSGKEAKNVFYRRFNNIAWRITGKLYWKGKALNRFGDEYQRFLDDAYRALSTNTAFADALISTEDAELMHSIGKNDCRKTVLTEYEFISRLYKCRGGMLI